MTGRTRSAVTALTTAESAFALLTCEPAPLAFDARPVPGLPDATLPLAELRTLLRCERFDSDTTDVLWRQLAHHAREWGPAWVVGAIGVALPALTHLPSPVTPDGQSMGRLHTPRTATSDSAVRSLTSNPHVQRGSSRLNRPTSVSGNASYHDRGGSEVLVNSRRIRRSGASSREAAITNHITNVTLPVKPADQWTCLRAGIRLRQSRSSKMVSATTALHREDVLPAPKMHADEIDIPLAMVERLIAGQFPRWAALPLRRLPSTGTVNALFRLGPDLVVRLCRVPWAAGGEAKEQRWLRQLAGYLPVAIPAPVALGQPTDEYPWTWSILRWLPGTNPVPGSLTAPDKLAADLAAFIIAFRAIDIPESRRAYRGGPLARLDEQTRAVIAKLDGTIDTDAATAIWDEALDIPAWDGPPTWVHADLLPGNILTADGRLSAVIDFATVGMGDPACDLIVGWTVLPANVRPIFREMVDCDDATWTRARARALSISLGGLHYYRGIEPTLATEAQYTIDQVLADSITS